MNVTELIKQHEGTELRMYICPAGYRTVGTGHNLDANPISQRAADVILEDDIEACRKQLEFNLSWFNQLDEVRQAALIDLAFNLGWQGLGRFRRFLSAMSRRDYAVAGAELVDSKWYSQVGNRGPRIVKMVQLGEWP